MRRPYLILCGLVVFVPGCDSHPTTTARPSLKPPSAEPAAWVRFRPPVGEASAAFPTTPDEMPQPPTRDPTRLYSYPRDGGAFQFGVSTTETEVPPARAQAFLEAVRNGSLARPGTRLLAEKSLSGEGLDAIEYRIATKDENVQIRYVVVVRGRYYYVLSSIGSADRIADSASDTFLASFRFEGDRNR